MSAFVVDPAHIDVLLSAAINGPSDHARQPRVDWRAPYVIELLGILEPLGPTTADAAGAALLRECIASVAHRYPDDPEDLPGPIPTPVPDQYEWTDFGRVLSAIECCKAVSCVEYQSCEHPGWADSGASSFCQRLRAAMVASMSGYGEADWHWSVEVALARAPRGRWRAF